MALYHSVINDSKKVKQYKQETELFIIEKGQFVGIEDAVLKYSKHHHSHFSYSAI
jgi:hypothetical protein